MNYRAVLKGYLKGIKMALTGGVILGLIAVWSTTPEINMSLFLKFLALGCLFLAGFQAGSCAKNRGYAHGGLAGMLLWLTWLGIVLLLIPEMVMFYAMLVSAGYCFFWGTVGGLFGVNLVLIKREENLQKIKLE